MVRTFVALLIAMTGHLNSPLAQENVGSSSSALLGGADDIGNPVTNSVVRVGGGCSGTLITSTIVLTSGHCIGNRDMPAGLSAQDDGCGNWQQFNQFYPFNPSTSVSISFGHDNQNPIFTAQATSYSIIGCVDIIMLRLARAVPASIAVPAVVATNPESIPNLSRATLQVVGWGTSGLEDLLKRPASSADTGWSLTGHAHLATAMANSNGNLFVATEGNSLWMKRADDNFARWRKIGHANNVVAMAALNNQLFAATNDNKLWVRNATPIDVNWQLIGHANNVRAMASLNGKLYAATSDNKLWSRDPVLTDAPWTPIGHANGIVAMGGANGRLYGATSTNNLWSRSTQQSDVDWQFVGEANRVRAMTGTDDGDLYASRRLNSEGFSSNSHRIRQIATGRLREYPCGDEKHLCIRTENALVQPGDSGGAVFLLRPGQPRVLIGVTRQTFDHGGKFVATFYSETSTGVLNRNTGIWIAAMAGPVSP